MYIDCEALAKSSPCFLGTPPLSIKYDLAPLLDVDGDGDLEVLTCEETENLGVIWYENPLRK